MLELDTRGYVIDLSMVKGAKQGRVLTEFIAFQQQRLNKPRLPVTCSFQLFTALRGEKYSERLLNLLTEWMGARAAERSESRKWLESKDFGAVRNRLLTILTSPLKFEINSKFSPAKQIATLSERYHFGIIAAGANIWKILRTRGVKYRLKIEKGGEKFLNYLKKNKKGFLKKAARIIIGKIISVSVNLLPPLNIVTDEVIDRIFIYINGT